MPPSQKARDLKTSLHLLDDAITLVDIALKQNPTPEEKRDLIQLRQRLVSERFVLQQEYDDELVGGTNAQGPSGPQLARVAQLSNAVEQATQQANAVSAAITFGGQVFTLATEIVTQV
jgi:hypothetical protein